MGDKHDHHGISAREMRGLAAGAIALPAGLDHITGRAAFGAKAMAGVPMQNRLCRGCKFGLARG